MVIFQGSDAYISPSWYASKQETGKVAPTWNYTAVHAYGHVKFIDDVNWLRAQLDELTHAHEQSQPRPWGVEDAPADYIEKLLRAIIGVEIPVNRLVGKWKLNQNRPPRDRASVISSLHAINNESTSTMAELIESYNSQD